MKSLMDFEGSSWKHQRQWRIFIFLECIYTMHDFIISILESRPSSWQSLMCEFYMI